MEIEQVIATWHAAVNARDEATVAQIVSNDVELRGPRGRQQGRAEVLAWMQRARITLEPREWHPIDAGEIIVEESATWPATDTATLVFTRYCVQGGAITSIDRFATLQDALAAQ